MLRGARQRGRQVSPAQASEALDASLLAAGALLPPYSATSAVDACLQSDAAQAPLLRVGFRRVTWVCPSHAVQALRDPLLPTATALLRGPCSPLLLGQGIAHQLAWCAQGVEHSVAAKAPLQWNLLPGLAPLLGACCPVRSGRADLRPVRHSTC